MLAKVSSLLLIALLTFSVAAKELVMGFCLCENALFWDNAPCLSAETKPDSPSCQSCGEDPTPDQSCEDCILPLAFEVPDYTWSGDSFVVTMPPADDDSPVQLSILDQLLPDTAFLAAALPSRAPPPPDTPLFLRHSVFRL